MTVTELHQKDITTLTEMAYELGLEGTASLRKQELIFRILRAETEDEGLLFVEGVLEIAKTYRLPHYANR